MERLQEIYILIKLAKMSVTEINTFSDDERKTLSEWFMYAHEEKVKALKGMK